MQYKVTPIDWALLMSLVVVWGSSFAMSKVALRHISPEWIAASRLCVGGAILSIIAIAQRSKPPATARDIFNYSWLGLIGDAAPFIVITWGMQYISSGVAGLLMGTIPLIVILMAHFTLPGEHLTRPRIAGFIVGFIGIVVLMGPENLLNIKYKQHYFDSFDFADERLLRTPIYHSRVNAYIKNLTLQMPDSITLTADYLIDKAKPNKETYKYRRHARPAAPNSAASHRCSRSCWRWTSSPPTARRAPVRAPGPCGPLARELLENTCSVVP